MPILEALRIAGQVVSNLPMKEAVETAAVKVREGASMNAALDETGYFPPMTVRLIASGEASGKLDEMLERAAVNQAPSIVVEGFSSCLFFSSSRWICMCCFASSRRPSFMSARE